jgi:hypothetical protein
MDEWTWAAALAAQAVSRHLNAAESEAPRFSTRLRRESIGAVEASRPGRSAPSANTAPRASIAALDDARALDSTDARRATARSAA